MARRIRRARRPSTASKMKAGTCTKTAWKRNPRNGRVQRLTLCKDRNGKVKIKRVEFR